MGKKSKKKRQENQTRSVGDLADNVSRTIPENVEAAASGNISTFFDELPDFVNDMQSVLVDNRLIATRRGVVWPLDGDSPSIQWDTLTFSNKVKVGST